MSVVRRTPDPAGGCGLMLVIALLLAIGALLVAVVVLGT